MGYAVKSLVCMVVVSALAAPLATAQAQPSPIPDEPFTPITLQLQPSEPEDVYAPPEPPGENEGINEGAVHFDLRVGYVTDYIFRGLEIFESPIAQIPPSQIPSEDRANLQVHAKLSWDLGKLPHPFIDVFVNFADSDPISSFEEIRPTYGIDWTMRPIVFSAGHVAYLYPDRDFLETSEIWGKITIDDSYFLRTQKPVFSPYVLAAYDYDKYSGWYFEAGVSHDFVLEDLGLTITAEGHVAYVRGIELFATVPDQEDINGFQHYQVGLIADYSLNKLLRVNTRYGQWSLQGFGYYTDSLDDDLLADDQLWGGAAIQFRY